MSAVILARASDHRFTSPFARHRFRHRQTGFQWFLRSPPANRHAEGDLSAGANWDHAYVLAQEKTALSDFKAFLLRGNVVDLAVAVVVGSAFGAVVTALVRDIITPIIALIFGRPDFSTLSFTINSSHFLYGDFLNFLIAFVSIAAAVFFFVVQPVNALMALRKTQPDVESETRTCTECLSDIPRAARKCAFCGSSQQPV